MAIIYRFRSMDNLIHEHNELEEQELVLSSPRDFNDPLEGYQDVFWEGDEVLWENLIRNYLLNLLWAAHTCRIFDEESFDDIALQPDLTPEDLPTDEFRQLFDSVCESFFDEQGFRRIPSTLASLPKPLKRQSLQLVLSVIHRPALGSVFEAMRASGINLESWPDVSNPTDSDTVLEMLTCLSDGMDEDSEIELLESVASHLTPIKSYAFLQRALQSGVEELELNHKKTHFLFESFPNRYIREICNSLIHTDWHTVCFAEECTSPPMWATYADEHKGAALMFRADRQTDDSWGELNVTGRTGWHGSEPIYDEIPGQLHAVDYESSPPEVDFFRFLGRLPLPKIESAWHSTPDGRTSEIVDGFLEDEDAWRENLWDLFHSMTTRKLGEWEHEREIRMVLPDLLGSEDTIRKVIYDISRLEGVVFGLRTDLEDRFEVMRILSQNSQDGDSLPVDFYEMVFDGTNFRKVKLDIGQ